MRCSTSRMRSDSVSPVSWSLTGTAPCITIGPASVSGITKCTVAQGLAMRIEAGEGRQQRGMDVEHPPVPGLGEFGRKQAHEAAETDQLDAVLIERSLQHRLEAGAVLAERLALD